MIVTSKWEGKVLAFDLESVTAREYKAIKRHTGLGFGEFWKSFSGATEGEMSFEMEVIDCLLWLFLKRNGHDIADPELLPDYSPLEFMGSFNVLGDASEAAGSEEAPLASGGTQQLI